MEQKNIFLSKSQQCFSPPQHTDNGPGFAAADLRGAMRKDVRGPPGRVLLLGASSVRRHRREETRARAGNGWPVCACASLGKEYTEDFEVEGDIS